MTEQKYDDFDAHAIVEQEGIGYAVMSYCSYKSFKNEETRKLWKEAEAALVNLARHLRVEGYE